MATRSFERAPARTFYRSMAVGLALFIIFGFAQFAARGLVDYRNVPLIFHIHGFVMASWLTLFAVQANLPTRGALAVHKKLGWASVVLAPLIVVLATATCVSALRNGFVPPFFTPGFFLSLVVVESLTFAGLVGWAVSWRKRTDWHRRLMLGAAAILLEPALGRLLPMPLLGWAGEWIAMGIQLLVPGAMMVNDRRTLKAVHPATLLVAVAIIFSHAVFALLSAIPAWNAFAEGIASG